MSGQPASPYGPLHTSAVQIVDLESKVRDVVKNLPQDQIDACVQPLRDAIEEKMNGAGIAIVAGKVVSTLLGVIRGV
jgi:hypothetical protein